MDVAEELRGVEYRVKLKVRGMALAAEARVYGMDPVEYTEYVLLAQKIDAELAFAERAQEVRNGFEAIGEAYGAMYRSLREGMESFARGFQRAVGQ